MTEMRMTWLEDVSPAAWIAPRLHPFGHDTGSVVPAGFDTYARVFHPLRTEDGYERWAERAARNNRIAHPEMQLHMISRPAGAPPLDPRTYEPGQGYDSGSLPSTIRQPLVGALREHTKTPERCWFCYWEGFGGLDDRGVTQRVMLPHRNYLLARGPIEHALESVLVPPSDQSANLWWPDDRAWIVATEIDFAWTYVGGTAELINDLLFDTRLEAMPARLSDNPAYDGDLLNAALDGPDRIYHLALRSEWLHASNQGAYHRSTIGRSLEDEGFIHCSFAEQVQDVADAFYRDRQDVVLLVIPLNQLDADLRVEAAGPGSAAYPHIYGPLPVEAVAEAKDVPVDHDGRLLVEPLLRDH